MTRVALSTPADELRAKWRRLGYRFAVPACAAPVDIERLVGATLTAGRDAPDLFWALTTWLTEFGDLVNIHRLVRMLPASQTHVAGAVMELAVSEGADRRLMLVARHCRPASPAETLFSIMRATRATEAHERENGLPLFGKWGLFCSSVTIKRDALARRAAVLGENRNLALRAVFGPGARADVLFALTQSAQTHIRQVARTTGFSYQPVYAEVKHLERNGFLTCTRVGTAAVVTLSPAAEKFLTALPV